MYWYLAVLSLVNAPVVDLRETAAPNSEIVSQVYYSEEVDLVEESGDYQKIRNVVDAYEGWILKGNLAEKKDKGKGNIVTVNRLSAHVYDQKDTIYGPILTLPFESRLEVIEEVDGPKGRWIRVALVDGKEAFIQRGDVKFDSKRLSKEEMCELAKFFLNLPYTWGGRSSFGYDCSGYVQMLYRQMGIAIPRDSRTQIKWEGFKEVPIEELKAGDLVFFGLAPDKIRHVGLCLGDGNFIHSTVAENKPWLRISNVNESEWNGSGRFVFNAGRTLK